MQLQQQDGAGREYRLAEWLDLQNKLTGQCMETLEQRNSMS